MPIRLTSLHCRSSRRKSAGVGALLPPSRRTSCSPPRNTAGKPSPLAAALLSRGRDSGWQADGITLRPIEANPDRPSKLSSKLLVLAAVDRRRGMRRPKTYNSNSRIGAGTICSFVDVHRHVFIGHGQHGGSDRACANQRASGGSRTIRRRTRVCIDFDIVHTNRHGRPYRPHARRVGRRRSLSLGKWRLRHTRRSPSFDQCTSKVELFTEMRRRYAL